MQVYEIKFEDKYSTYKVFATETGKILETSLSYTSGLSSRYMADHIVELPNSWWDAQSSQGNLYWITEEDIATWGDLVSVQVVDYPHPYETENLTPTNCQIGDRVVLTPVALMTKTGDTCHANS